MAERLNEGRLLPAAKPVSSFITPAQIEAQKPAAPTRLMASNGGIGLQATAAKPNVQGYNPGEQLGEALTRFGATLSKTAAASAELYASHEYQAGQNEVMKAQLQVEKQVDQSSVEYADQNRQLARVDPMAALAMDQTNPFRHAGRQSALSQLASGEISAVMDQTYRQNAGALALKDPTEPALNEIKANAVNTIVQKYGLDPSKEGFARYFLPALNRAWERTTAQHIQDRNDYLKDTVWRTAGVGVAQIFRSAREKGQDMGQAAALAGQLLDQEAVRLGLPGEATNMKQRAITLARQTLLNAGERDAAAAVGGIPVGAPDGEGYRMTATQMFQLDMMEDDDRYGEIRRREQERELEPLRQQLEAESAQVALQMEDGPKKLEVLNTLINSEQFKALPLGERLEIISKANKLGEDIYGQGFSQEAGGSFIAELDQKFGFGSQRDMAGAEARLQEVLKQTAPEDRPRIRQQFAEWQSRQQRQPWDLINPAIANRIKANLAQHHPGLDVAALRGANNIEGILQWGDATSKESSARQLAAYRTHVLTRLDEERTRLGRDLSDSESLGVINKALQEYGTKDQSARDYLFPKVPGAAPAGGGGAAAPAKPTPPPGRRPASQPGVAPTLLDNMPDRQNRLKNWRNEPVLSLSGTSSLALEVLNGGSFPASFRRAAKDAGTTPEQLLIQQVDFYPGGIKLTPQQRNQILKQGTQARALNNNRQTQGSIDVAALVRQSSSWMTNALLGISPAAARTSEVNLMDRYGSGGGYTGGGGGAAPDGDVARFRRAIIGQESGGNYRAVNPDSGALGIGQVMPYNVGPWTQKYLGRRLTPQQFLNSPAAQDAVVNGRFRDMLAEQRAAGYSGEQAVRRAAAVWYSGQAGLWNDTRPQYSNGRAYPSIAEYTRNIWHAYRR